MADGHDTQLHPKATFKSFVDSTEDEWKLIGREAGEFNKGLAERVLTHLRILKGDYGGVSDRSP